MKFFRLKYTKILFILAVFILLIFLNPKGLFDPFREVTSFISYPFKLVFHKTSLSISGWLEFVSSIGELKQENERLIGENRKLLAQNAQLKDMGKENEVLRRELELLPRGKFNLEIAEVIGRDPYGTGNWIEINKGEKEGIKEGMPVITSEGILVGKIGKALAYSSQVDIITNPQSAVNAVDIETKSKGIIRGSYGLGLIMDMILESDAVNEGDQIITSEIGKFFPQGLLIGEVESVKLSDENLFQQAIIRSPIKFSDLQIVAIIK